MGRLVAGGFEVHNDTPDLYKGGSVTVYSAPQEPSACYTGIVTSDLYTPKGVSLINHKGLPATRTEASLYRSARTWEAADGALVPFQLNLAGEGVKYSAQSGHCKIFRSGESPNTGGFIQRPFLGSNNDFVGPINPQRGAPLDTSGAFFTGLNVNTVLTLTVKTFTEVAPTIREGPLLKLASPSAELDQHAINCYNHCIAELPPGVPVGFNDAGRWWRMVLNKLKEQAPKIVPAITSLVAGSIDPALLPAANAVSRRTGGKLVTKALDRAINNSQKRSDRRAVKAKTENQHRKR